MKRLFASIASNTLDLSRIEAVIYVDEDDHDSHELNCEFFKIVKIIGPSMSMGGYNTACMAAASGEIFILANDDMVIRTKGWDDRIRKMHAEFSDKIYLGYGNDLFKGKRLCSFPILSRQSCVLIGDPYPAAYRRTFIDNHLLDIFRRLKKLGFDRLRYDADLVIEHLHYRAGKSKVDETYRQGCLGRFDDDVNFISLIEQRDSCAKRLASGIRGEAISNLKKPRTAYAPRGFFCSVIDYFVFFVLDAGLPIRYRLYLWYWFVGRYVASRGCLRPLVRP